MSVLLLYLAACKKKEEILLSLDKNQEISLTKAKEHFQNQQPLAMKQKKAKQANQREVGVPDAYYEFYPAWDWSSFHTRSNGNQVILTPLVRDAQVTYPNELILIRRLRTVINANGQVVEAKIIELISFAEIIEKTSEEEIMQSLINAEQSSFAAMASYDLAYERGTTTGGGPVMCIVNFDFHFNDGINLIVPMSFPSSSQICEMYAGETINFYVTIPIIPTVPIPGGGAPHTPNNPPSGGTVIIVSPGGNTYYPHYPSTGGPKPQNPGTPILGGDWGQELPYEPSPLLKRITKKINDVDASYYDFGNLSKDEIRKLDSTLNLLNNKSPLMAKLFKELETNHKLSWGTFSSPRTIQAQYMKGGKKIQFNISQDNPFEAHTLMEELIHAFQHKHYGARFTSIPNSNIELEAKLIRNLMYINANKAKIDMEFPIKNRFFSLIDSAIPTLDPNEDIYTRKDIYGFYLKAIRISPNASLPKNMNELSKVIVTNVQLIPVFMVETRTIGYWELMAEFRSLWAFRFPDYAVPNSDQIPEVLFWLANNCNCTY